MDINDIKTYLKCDNQKKAVMQAIKYGISKKKFFEMKKKAGFTNWTFEKRKYKKELELKKDLEKDLETVQEKIQEKDLEKIQEKDLEKDLETVIEDQEEYNNIIMVEEIEDIETPYNIWLDIK